MSFLAGFLLGIIIGSVFSFILFFSLKVNPLVEKVRKEHGLK